MNFVQPTHGIRPFTFEYGGNTPSARVERKLREEVLAHFYAPATRQRVLDSIAPPPMAIEEEMVKDSPPFKPAALTAFESRGFVRQNRWGK